MSLHASVSVQNAWLRCDARSLACGALLRPFTPGSLSGIPGPDSCKRRGSRLVIIWRLPVHGMAHEMET